MNFSFVGGSLLAAVLCLSGVRSGLSAAELSGVVNREDIVFRADFEGDDAFKGGWMGTTTATLEKGFSQGQSAALALSPGDRHETALITCSIPVAKFRGCTLRGSVMVRAEGVSAKPKPWNGIKFMLVLHGLNGSTYPQAPIETGSFDWRRATFSTRIPVDVTNASLVLGLEDVKGKVWFDDLKLVVSKVPVADSLQRKQPSLFVGHDVPRLRGAMVSPDVTAESLHVLGRDWNANLIRWQLIRSGAAARDSSLESFDSWLEGELKKLDAILPSCEKEGLMVVIDLHSPPGGKPTTSGYSGSDSGLFTDKKAQDKFVNVWAGIAARYKNARPIWGYDLANEPVEEDVGEDCADWQALSERAARAIRAVDPQRAIIIEPTGWGSPDGLLELQPLPISNVVYSVHMYLPHAFTHQGVFENGPSYRYPGKISGKEWNKAQLERALQPAIEFQKRYNVQIYIGEFSAIRWAPDGSASRYLADLIDIFEAHGWDWSYHAFREWQGWSAEHGPDRLNTRRSETPTDRQQLLCDWFRKNQKPNW